MDDIARISKLYSELCQQHTEDVRRIGNRVPVGGAHMDTFFRMEGLRGMLAALRGGASLEDAMLAGKREASAAVRAWNARREWHVHRWENTADEFIERAARK